MTPLEEAVARIIREWVWTRRHNGNSELIGADQAAKRIALLPEIVKMQEALKEAVDLLEDQGHFNGSPAEAAWFGKVDRLLEKIAALQPLKKEAE